MSMRKKLLIIAISVAVSSMFIERIPVPPECQSKLICFFYIK